MGDREVAPIREVQRVLALEEGCGAVAAESGGMSKWTHPLNLGSLRWSLQSPARAEGGVKSILQMGKTEVRTSVTLPR